MFSAHGSPDDPHLVAEADADSESEGVDTTAGTGTDAMKGKVKSLLSRIRKRVGFKSTLEEEQREQVIEVDEGVYAKAGDVELAHEALERVRGVVRQVTPFRVVVATVVMAFLLFSLFAIGFWMVPRDAVTVEVVYGQGGPGQYVLLEVHNLGSRPITDVSIRVTFSDLDGVVLNETQFHRETILAHTSVAGDDLELMIEGVTVWAEYNIQIVLEYDYYDGPAGTQSWTHQVGEWTSETFSDDATRHYF
jgi:hypothetical protein